MKTHYTAKELAGLPGLPGTEQRVNAMAKRENWLWQKRAARGGGREYAVTSLPKVTREYLAKNNTSVGFDDGLTPAAQAIFQQVEQMQLSADEKEQQRIAARAESATKFSSLPTWQQTAAKAKFSLLVACNTYITKFALVCC